MLVQLVDGHSRHALRRRSAAPAHRAVSAARGCIELAEPHLIEQRRALERSSSESGNNRPLGSTDRVARTAHALQEGVDRPRRAELAHQVHVADVDAELERGGRHQRVQLARLQALLGLEPVFPARLPWCAVTCSSPSRSARWRATRSATRRWLTNISVVRCSRSAPRGGRTPRTTPRRHHRVERRGRHLDREVALADVAGSTISMRRPSTDQETRHPSSGFSWPTGRCAPARARTAPRAARA